LRTTLQGGWQGELLNQKKDGTEFPIALSTSTVCNEKGQAIALVGIATDITGRKQADELLKETSERLHEAQKLACIGVWDWKSDTDTVTWTNELYSIAGLDPMLPAPTYKEHSNLYTPESWELLKNSVEKAMETGESYQLELELIRPNGDTRYVNAFGGAKYDSKGQVIGLFGTVQDITERKQTEDALKNLLSLTEAMLESIHNGILVISHQRTVIKTNAKFAEMWRIPGHILNSGDDKILLDYVYGQLADPDAFNTKVEELYEKPEAESFDLIYFKDGRIFERVSRPIYLGGEPKGRVWSFLDITERKQAEEALHLEKENFRHSLDDSPLGVRIVTTEGDTIYANQTILNFYGYDSLGELQRTPLKDRYTPESYAQAQKRKHQRERGDLSATRYKVNIVRKNGEIRYLQVFRKEVLWDGIRQFQILYDDITERKHAEDALHESEERYRRLVEGSPEAIAVHSKGKFVFVNPAGAKLIGAGSPQELVGKPILDVVHPDSRSQVIERLRHVAEGKEAPLFEEKFLKFDGSVIDVEVVGIPFSYHGQTATQVVVRDITKRKLAGDEIRKSKKLLEDLHKHLDEIRENERALISREIHDQIGQSLTALKLDLNWIDKYIKNSNPEAAAKLQDMIELVTGTIKDVQRISSELRPGILDDLGLAAAIELR
jgi:PAS domain S-box-containing protein